MRGFEITLTTYIAVVVSCLIWIAGISWLLIHFLALSASEGWVLVGALCAIGTTAMGVLLYEVRHAIDLPADVDIDELDLPEGLSAVNPDFLPFPVSPAPVLRVTHETF